VRQTRAFTLVEVCAVVLLIGILAAATSLAIGRAMRGPSRKLAVSWLTLQDRLFRARAIQAGAPVRVTIDIDHSELISGTEADQTRQRLPAGTHVFEVRTAEGVHRTGQVELAVSPRGWTPSYALRIGSNEDEQEWLVVAGSTGWMEAMHDEAQVRVFFEKVCSPRRDAD
jgi:prepilin-type N-terminal cleavage/methylation domain-containing protein